MKATRLGLQQKKVEPDGSIHILECLLRYEANPLLKTPVVIPVASVSLSKELLCGAQPTLQGPDLDSVLYRFDICLQIRTWRDKSVDPLPSFSGDTSLDLPLHNQGIGDNRKP